MSDSPVNAIKKSETDSDHPPLFEIPEDLSDIETEYFENLNLILGSMDKDTFQKRFLNIEDAILDGYLSRVALETHSGVSRTNADGLTDTIDTLIDELKTDFGYVDHTVFPSAGLTRDLASIYRTLCFDEDELTEPRDLVDLNNPLHAIVGFSKGSYEDRVVANEVPIASVVIEDNRKYMEGGDPDGQNLLPKNLKLSELPTHYRYLQISSKPNEFGKPQAEIVKEKSQRKAQIAIPSIADFVFMTLHTLSLGALNKDYDNDALSDSDSSLYEEIDGLSTINLGLAKCMVTPSYINKFFERDPVDLNGSHTPIKELKEVLPEVKPYQLPDHSSATRILKKYNEKREMHDFPLIKAQNTFIADEIKRIEVAVNPEDERHVEIVNLLMTGKFGKSLEVMGGADIGNWKDGFSREQAVLRKKIQDLVSPSLSGNFIQTADPLLMELLNSPLVSIALEGGVEDIEKIHTAITSDKVRVDEDTFSRVRREMTKLLSKAMPLKQNIA